VVDLIFVSHLNGQINLIVPNNEIAYELKGDVLFSGGDKVKHEKPSYRYSKQEKGYTANKI
jgi:hypothetical protein